MQVQEGGVALAGQLGAHEGLWVLGVGDLLTERGEGGELAPAALAGRVGDLLVDVVGEELKGRALAVLLAHEQHGGEGRQQRAEGHQRPRRVRRAVAEGAVAGLVVVGGEDHELLRRAVLGGRAEAAAAEARVGAVVDVRAVEGLRQRGERVELGVPALGVAGAQRPQRVVEVVAPGRVAAPAAERGRADDLRVVEAALGDHVHVAPGGRARGVHAAAERGHQVLGARVEDRVDRVQAQPVEVEVGDPLLGALQHPLAHRVAVGVVVVHAAPPDRLVLGREVGTEGLQRLRAGGADVVVDHVEQHGEAGGVGRVDEPGEALGAAVGGVRGRQVDAVVAPAVAAGELGDGHQLDRGDAELAQGGEVLDRRREGARGRERPDVQLVDDELGERDAGPAVVTPGQARRVEHARAAAQPLGLPAGGRIGQLVAVEREDVVVAVGGGGGGLEDAVAGVRERMLGVAHAQRQGAGRRGPDAERRRPVRAGAGAERALPRVVVSGHEPWQPTRGGAALVPRPV